MKIILVIRQSLDGIISREINDGRDWGSSKDMLFFEKKARGVGVVIMGKNTYEKTKISHPQIIKQAKVLVFTHKKMNHSQNVIFFSGSVNEGVRLIEKKGVKEAILIGGGNLNNQFLKQKLINELFITVSPRIFAKKTRVFGEEAIDVHLSNLRVKKLGKNELLLQYKVK